MAIIHHCGRCGFTAKGKTEFDAERAYSVHTCRHPDGRPMRKLEDLPMELLRQLALKQITEDQAFARIERV